MCSSDTDRKIIATKVARSSFFNGKQTTRILIKFYVKIFIKFVASTWLKNAAEKRLIFEMLHILRRAVMTTTAGPANSANDKKRGAKLVFNSDASRVLDRGTQYDFCGIPAPLLISVPRPPAGTFLNRKRHHFAGVWKAFKYCTQCNLIMVERAKWKNFEEVKYCSDKCRNASKRKTKPITDIAADDGDDVTIR